MCASVWTFVCVCLCVNGRALSLLMLNTVRTLYNVSAMTLTQGMCTIAHFCIVVVLVGRSEREYGSQSKIIYIYIFLCSKFCGYMHVSLRRFRTSFVCLYIYLYFDIILMWVWTLCSHLALVLFLLCYTYSNIYGYHKYIAIVVATTTVGNVVHWLTNQTYKYTLESTS